MSDTNAQEKKAKSVRFGCVVVRCKNPNCHSEFQDKRYGAGVRVHNRIGKASVPSARCTVCLTVKEV